MARCRSFCGIFLIVTARPFFLKMPAWFASVSGANPVHPEIPIPTLTSSAMAGVDTRRAAVAASILDSSLRDVKQDDSNNEVAPSRSGEQIDDVLDGVVGAVVGGFESAVWAMLRVRTAVEAAVGKWSAQLFVEEQK